MRLNRQKNFRLSDAESKALGREAKKAGLTESQWLRLLVLTALGESSLFEQLERVRARVEESGASRAHQNADGPARKHEF